MFNGLVMSEHNSLE